jgi:hypothetical protein
MVGARLLSLALISLIAIDTSAGGSPALDLARAASAVRAFLSVAARSNATNDGSQLLQAAETLATAGNRLPRWAILHAVAEEHERLSWVDGGLSSWHGARAACLYRMVLESPALEMLKAKIFAELFGGAARAVATLKREIGEPLSQEGQISLLGPAASRTAQEKQCNATMVEHERWKAKRESVANFARQSPFSGFREEHLDSLAQLWPNFSPEGAGEAFESHVRPRAETDLRATLAAVDEWRLSGLVAADDSRARVEWWDALLRACAVDSLHRRAGHRCAEGSRPLLETELDAMKSQINALHISLNSASFPLDLAAASRGGALPGGALPVWLRVCQRTFPLTQVLSQLGRVRGISHAVLVVTVDRDEMESVLRTLLAVDFMHVRIYMHPFTETRRGLAFGTWDTGVHRLNSHFLFGLRLVLQTMRFRLHTNPAAFIDDVAGCLQRGAAGARAASCRLQGAKHPAG